MSWAFRSCALAAGAAALLSTQSAYAAPVRTAPAVDPLVSLSMLSTTQSRAAVCGTSAACTLPMAATAASTATAQDAQDDYSPPPPPPGKRVNALYFIAGGAILIAIIVALLSGGGDGDGDLAPISPA